MSCDVPLVHSPPKGGGVRARLLGLRNSRAAKNFFWLATDRGIRLGVGLIVGSWSARYLGKSDFGLLNYAASLVAIFTSIASWGMEGLVVREIIRNDAEAGRYLGTAMWTRLATSCSCVAFAVLASLGSDWSQDLQQAMLVGILGVGAIGQSLEAGELLFQARTEMSKLIIPRLALFFITNLAKVVLILSGGSLMAFGLLTMVDQVSGGILTLFMSKRMLGNDNRLHFSKPLAAQLLKESWPLALGALSVIAYMKSGQVMIFNLLGNSALGIYSAAARISETASFLPVILASSLLPGLVRARVEGKEAYERATLRYFRISILMAYMICGPLFLGSGLLIRLLFGDGYAMAAPVMAVHVWSIVFVFIGVARQQFLLNEGLTKASFVFTLAGLVANLACNFLLIPIWGVMGAAIATVVSYAISAYLSSFCIPATRHAGYLQTLAIISPWKVMQPLSK